MFVKASSSSSSTPVPIDQRKEFNLSRTPTRPDPAAAASPARPRTPSRSAATGAVSALKALVGPYSFLLKELRKERGLYSRDEDVRDRDLRTVLNQVTLFRHLLTKKLGEDRSHEERLLLLAWQLVYDAEEEAFGLKSKERIATEINKIHAQLIDMVRCCNAFVFA